MVALLIAIVILFLPCCGVLDYTEITVELPEPPPLWPAKLTDGVFLVRYLESADFSTGVIGEIEISPGSRSVRLRLPNLPVVPVIAVPRFGIPPAALKACGAIHPRQLADGDRLTLTWADGFLAQLLLECAASGDSVQAVNTPKLQLEILKRSGGNPWRLDTHALKMAVVNETLAYRSLKLLPSHDVEIEAAPGRWIDGNPHSLTPVERLSGDAVFPDLSEGVHSFFRVDGNDRIDISVESTGWTAVYPVRGGGSAGNW